ncbi:MAG: glycosyltransferase [Candidatus Staskawiczbacteria bacterium]|jgi:glycosyltransferase involved in cell wall biosynthesis
MKTLFLSHSPHQAHISFAKAVGAKIKITPFAGLVEISKKWRAISYVYPAICLTYGFFLPTKEDIVLVDGGSSLWAAVAIKMRFPKIKIIYLDGDLYIINLTQDNIFVKKAKIFALKKIDAIISVSDMNKRFAQKIINIPIEVCPPHPKKINKTAGMQRKNYGLYVGRLDPDKNIERIIDFAIQCPYFEKFIILGDGVQKKYVEKITKKNKKIIYLGQRKDVETFYSKCKFLIHIPDFDPHPCTTMEAAICGCYPIISRGVGTNYLFSDIFIADDPADFNLINKKIKYILENEQLVKKLLEISAKNVPAKEKSIENFKEKFNRLIKL